jgi:hypothetical protein
MYTAFSKVLTASIIRAMINGHRRVSTHLAYSTASHCSGRLHLKQSQCTCLSYFHKLHSYSHCMIYVPCNASGAMCSPTYIRHWYSFLLIHHTAFSKIYILTYRRTKKLNHLNIIPWFETAKVTIK